ncbi:hypothetical protein HPP92_014393 [Vanilla planifolia]|uniref:Uncharacterized protein n=1 Tax=Vanilla planifolia TaxID=51239 RepID=A0A835QTS3_VANPL|nr:hypothetical protein HPP92_014393 [Vanilla planifolia]
MFYGDIVESGGVPDDEATAGRWRLPTTLPTGWAPASSRQFSGPTLLMLISVDFGHSPLPPSSISWNVLDNFSSISALLKPPPLRHTKHIRHKPLQSQPQASTRIFFTALYILALGTEAPKPNISTIGADQFMSLIRRKGRQGLLLQLVDLQHLLGHPHCEYLPCLCARQCRMVPGICHPTIGLGISILIFLCRLFLYRHKLPQGSPLPRWQECWLLQFENVKCLYLRIHLQLYEMNQDEYKKKGQFRIQSTNSMRLLQEAFNKKKVIKSTAKKERNGIQHHPFLNLHHGIKTGIQRAQMSRMDNKKPKSLFLTDYNKAEMKYKGGVQRRELDVGG